MIHWFWKRFVPLLATVKLAVGLAAFFLTYDEGVGSNPTFPHILYLLFILAFGATAALLLLGGRGDKRAVALGSFFLVGASAWCNKPLSLLAGPSSGLASPLLELINAFEMDAFLPFFLWVFVRDFPEQPPAGTRRFMSALVGFSAWAGISFFSLNLLRFVFPEWDLLERFIPMQGKGMYYVAAMFLTAAAFGVLIWKSLALRGPSRRRVRLFLQGLAIAFGPMLIEILMELALPGYRAFMARHPGLKLGVIIAFSSLALTVPFIVPYAVLVHRVLDVKLIARRAIQYALARTSVLALVAVPLVALCAYLILHRSLSLSEIFSGKHVFLLLSAAAIGAVALGYRRRLLDAIDRRFFREQYDARQILTLLVERIRSISEVESLASLVSREIDLALHLEGISMMVLDSRSGMLTDPRSRARRLDASSSLALTVSNASDPLEVDLENLASSLLKLPEKERHWLVDSGFRLIVPILARDGSLLGMVGLGEKKSGLPFLREDRQLLHAIASNAAWVLELDQGRTFAPKRSWMDTPDVEGLSRSEPSAAAAEYAKECANCGSLFATYTVFCANCSRKLEVARVPYVLPGKFRFEKRIGVGGMGIVYHGADLALGRPVAIKTLRRVSPEDAMRLRREARTAAAASHPHLAPVYALETWQGTPMLVMEMLEGGTLAQRMTAGRTLSPLETVDLGIAMADALAHLHSADILHRDIKPTNIGYTRDGIPKLMDFGIARMIKDLDGEMDFALMSSGDDDEDSLLSTERWGDEAHGAAAVSAHRLVGTLGYLSPEAVTGQPADPSFDLWSLSVVLYECLLGRKIFAGGDAPQVIARIKLGRVPEFSQILPELDGTLGELFRSALHKTRARRPASARELRQRLIAVRAEL